MSIGMLSRMSSFMRQMAQGCALLLASLLTGPLFAAQVVTVSGAYFPPYVVKPEQALHVGLLPQLLDALNQLQSDYRFVKRPTAIPRRFGDFEQGRIDIALFENPAWGWQDIEHSAVDMGLEDAEVFVTRDDAGRDQHYFEHLHDKRLALFNGYHYGFASFNAEAEYLRKNFNASLSYSHDSNLLMVLHGRADVAAVTRSYVEDFLQRHRQYSGRLLVSQTVDQFYRHQALIRPGAPIDALQFRELLEELRANGQLAEIFEPFQITVSSPATGSSVVTDATH